VDSLGEVRRALRILRRVERSLLFAERAEVRKGKKAAERLAHDQAVDRELAEAQAADRDQMELLDVAGQG